MHGETLRPEAAGDGDVGGAPAGDRCCGQGLVDRHAVHGLPRQLMAGLQQRFGIRFTALGSSALIPWFSSGDGKEAVVAGGKGQALPSISSSLHQGHSTGIVSRPGGIDAENQGWWGLNDLVFREQGCLIECC